MRIMSFTKLYYEALKPHQLKNCKVVIDGQNYFFKQYENSKLQYVFGCECDHFAAYLRKKLDMFRRANVECFFIFKAGHRTSEKVLHSDKENWVPGTEFVLGQNDDTYIYPNFLKEVYKQVLDEMGFKYTFCQFEGKTECIAFAQKHKYPVISFDSELCLTDVDYIFEPSLKLNEETNTIECGLFKLDYFLQKHNLTKNKLAIFITLTDEKRFPRNHFAEFINTLLWEETIEEISFDIRNRIIISWLSENTIEEALGNIFIYENDKEKFLKEKQEIREMICRRENTGIPSLYLENGRVEMCQRDPHWFEKELAAKNIPSAVANLYYFGMILGSCAISDKDEADPMLLSMDIIKYIYNLLTGFQRDEIVFCIKKSSKAIEQIPISLIGDGSVSHPGYFGMNPFENGRERLPVGLFQHFLIESLRGFHFDVHEELPEDVRLLMIALVYFSHKKKEDTAPEAYGVILSYTALSRIFVGGNRGINAKLDENRITTTDRNIARRLLGAYHRSVDVIEAKQILDRKILHPLIEFQHCLAYMNYLNDMCGSPYKLTEYSKTYNSTLVYKVVREIRLKFKGNGSRFVEGVLHPAPTVLAFVQRIFAVYEELIKTIE